MAELEHANAALRRDIEHERELERQRLAFFSAASHELKTPVTILKGQLGGMLAQVGVYRDREKYLARALEVTGRMERLIREILTISRIESGGAALKCEAVDLSALLAAQLESAGELIAQRAFRLTANIQPGVQMRGNADLLSNALDNILMNALLYCSRRRGDTHMAFDQYAARGKRRRAHSRRRTEHALHALLPRRTVPQPQQRRQRAGAVSGKADTGIAWRALRR